MKYYILILIFIFNLLACKNPASTTKNKMEFATGFSIVESSTVRSIVTDSLKRKLTILHSKSKIGKEKLFTVKSPVRRVICGTTTVAALLGSLGELKSIKGVTLSQNQWYINDIKKGIQSGKIKVLGDGMASFNMEEIVKFSPNIVFTTSDHDRNRAIILKKRNIKSAIVHEYMEDSFIGQFEWVKFLAEFYNKGKLADKIFKNIKKSYFDIKKIACNSKKKTSVAWGSLYEGKAYVPGGDSLVSKAISDAGGQYLMKDFKGTGALPISLEKFYDSYVNSEIFIYSSTIAYGAKSIIALIAKSEILGKFKSFKEGKVWCYKPSYWQAIDRPDLILKDLAAMIHPELFPDHKLKFFQKMPRR